MIGRQIECKMPHDHRQGNRSLLQRKRRPDTGPRPGAEGKIGITLDFLARIMKKPVRIEMIRPVP